MSGVSGRSLAKVTLVAVVLITAVLIGVDALVAAGRAESNAIRVVGGCSTVVSFDSAGRYRLSVEDAGPAVDESSSCVPVAAGVRSGVVDSVRLVAPDGLEATLEVGTDVPTSSGPAWERRRIGVLRVDAQGEYTVTPQGSAVEGSVVVIGADPRSVRDGGLVVSVVLIGLAAVMSLVLFGRRGQRSPKPPARPVLHVAPGGTWAPPNPADRVG